MNTPEESSTFQAVRVAHRRLRKVVRDQNRQLVEAQKRERQMRLQIQGLPEPGLKAYADVIRRRGDLSMAEALGLVAEVFNADE